MKSVVICSSARFAKEVREFAQKLRDLGVVVYQPHLYRASGGNWEAIADFDKKFVALGLTHDHFQKIRMADVVFVYNQDGYVGNSTTLEIGYAKALDKPIYALINKDEEICRYILFSGFTSTPEELVKYLK